MSNLVIYCDDENKVLNLEKIADAVYKTLKQKINLSCELCFCDEEEIKELNLKTRNIDSVTDVLSFPAAGVSAGETVKKKNYPFDTDESGRVFLGSIMICLKRAREQASEYGHSEKREIAYLTVHGLMHLFGYDHMKEDDKIQMRETEEAALALAGIPRE